MSFCALRTAKGMVITMRVLDNLDQLAKVYSVGKKMKDSIPIGFLGGLAGTIAMNLSNLMFKKTGLSEKTYAQYAGSVLLNPFRLLLKKNYYFGQALNLMTGSVLGIPLFYVLKKTGKDNHLFKGVVYGTFTWEILYSLGQRVGLIRSKTYTTASHITSLIDNLVYGIVSTATMVFLTDPTVFTQAKKQIETSVENQPSKLNQIPIDNPIHPDENITNIYQQ